MSQAPSRILPKLMTWLAAALAVKVTVAVVAGYRSYFPPDFASDFLRGRESYFFGAYRWAFDAHIATGPASIFLGLLLLNDRFRSRFAKWHRRLGRVQVALVLLVVAPSGLWMARYAAPGVISAIGFAVLSILTGLTIAMGWHSAVARRFADHRRWMTRSFLLLCSAVVLRVLGGLGTVLGVTSLWFDPIASWASWVVPLGAYEWMNRRKPTPLRRAPTAVSAEADTVSPR